MHRWYVEYLSLLSSLGIYCSCPPGSLTCTSLMSLPHLSQLHLWLFVIPCWKQTVEILHQRRTDHFGICSTAVVPEISDSCGQPRLSAPHALVELPTLVLFSRLLKYDCISFSAGSDNPYAFILVSNNFGCNESNVLLISVDNMTTAWSLSTSCLQSSVRWSESSRS